MKRVSLPENLLDSLKTALGPEHESSSDTARVRLALDRIIRGEPGKPTPSRAQPKPSEPDILDFPAFEL